MLSGGPPASQWQPVSDPDVRARLPIAARAAVREVDLTRLGIETPAQLTRRGFGLPAGLAHTELFVNGEPMRPARYPNPDAGNGGWLLTGKNEGNWRFELTDEHPKSWKSADGVWAYGYWQFDWAESWEQVEAIRDNTVLLREGTGGPVAEFGLRDKRRFFFANVLEALDQPGEYWIDVRRNRLVAWLPEDAKDVVVSRVGGPLIEVRKTNRVTIKGLTLQASRGPAVLMSESHDCLVQGVTVRNAGTRGIEIRQGSRCGVKDSGIYLAGNSGVALEGGDRKTLTRSDHFVENCEIARVSRWCRTYNPAVSVDGVGQRVVGCTISDLPHNAILFWGNDHLFERNDIRRVCLETSDSGAIYTGRDTTTRGTVIRWNRFREIEPRTFTEGNWGDLVMSVYLDDCQAGIEITGNIFEAKGTGIMIGGGRDNLVFGNVFLNNHPAIRFDMRARGWAKEHFTRLWGFQSRIKDVPVLESPWRERYPRLYRDIKNNVDLSYAGGNEVTGNVVVGGKWIEYSDGLTQKDLLYRDNLVRESPITLEQAVKLAKSPAGPIPLNKIGRRAK